MNKPIKKIELKINDIKSVRDLVKKLSGKAPINKPKVINEEESIDKSVRSANADNIFREMKKLPYSE